MQNDVKLQEGHPVDENLRPIKVGGEATALEVSKEDVRVNNLYVNGTTTGVSASDSTKLPLAGGTMTGDITTDSDIISTDLTINDAGTITLDSHTGVFEMKKAGTKFADTYAGMILGYTRIQNDGTGSTDFIIQIDYSSMTVLQTTDGTDLSIQFIVPPSGNVEIQCSFWMAALSDGAKFSLSTDASYAELGITHTYDADHTVFIDETDHNMFTINFSVTGLTAGTDTTYYLAGLASGSGVTINHGRSRLGGAHFPPIIMKAIALPATIVTGE